MASEEIPVRLVLDAGDDDPEYAEEQLQYLIEELRGIDLASIDRAQQAPPPGTRGTGALELGALLIGLGSSGSLLPVLVGLVQDWLNRRRSGTVRLKLGDDEIELTAATDEVQQRALDEFLRRHGQ
ncbi:effector-associated constant component EACC1 [Streptomyces sp. IBSBF 2435]|uniref:effector-associated constant component EACC1 n=1 Tax=Streptomyces sp. IBSBF 2435 TaxID=2903531 RepID=UPI002FDC4FCB